MALNVVEIWRDLHKTPELGFEENKTSAYLAEALEKLGFAVTRGVGKTGVMGVIRGAEPGPVLMLRADMDALPFRNDDGSIEAVHACGHDSHCAMVLAAASELAGRVRRGTLKILFQPGEETLHGALEHPRRLLRRGRRLHARPPRPQHDLRRNPARHGRQGPHRSRPQARRLTHHKAASLPRGAVHHTDGPAFIS